MIIIVVSILQGGQPGPEDPAGYSVAFVTAAVLGQHALLRYS
jgi:hypothetical protein